MLRKSLRILTRSLCLQWWPKIFYRHTLIEEIWIVIIKTLEQTWNFHQWPLTMETKFIHQPILNHPKDSIILNNHPSIWELWVQLINTSQVILLKVLVVIYRATLLLLVLKANICRVELIKNLRSRYTDMAQKVRLMERLVCYRRKRKNSPI